MPLQESVSMKLLRGVCQFALGRCHHSQLSRVFTIKKWTYQVCLECGQEFEYSWALMHSLQSNVAPELCTRAS
jgi:hypothetical protein